MTNIVSVYAVFGNVEEARSICRTAIEDGLASCANILGPCESLYRWKDRLETAVEVPALLKTQAELSQALIARIEALHSYDVPAAIVWPIEAALPAYSAWVEEVTRPGIEKAEKPSG